LTKTLVKCENVNKMVFLSIKPEDTYNYAKDFASGIKSGAVISLTGPLGSGKTVFVQGLAQGLGIKAKIKSPTYILMQNHGRFYHVDAYRLENSQALLNLGFKEILADKNNLIIIEWGDKIRDILPKDTININLEHIDQNKRRIEIGIK